jgi:hypothetical protein
MDLCAFKQCTGRTDTDTLSAGDTFSFSQISLHGRLDYGFKTTADKPECGVVHHFVTNPDALATKYALVRISLNERMVVIIQALMHFAAETLRLDVIDL